MNMLYIPSDDSFLAIKACRIMLKNFNIKSVLDMGCGTGIIGLTLSKEFKIKIGFSDIDEGAINYVKARAKEEKISAKFYISDLFDNIKDNYDLVCFNAPYLPGKRKSSEDKQIFGGKYGNETIKRFLSQCKNKTKYAVVVYSSLSNFNPKYNNIIFISYDNLFFERIFAAAFDFTNVK